MNSGFYLLISSCILPLAAHAQVGSQTDLIFGHYEIQIGYDPTSPNANDGWSFGVSYDEDDNFEDAEGIVRLDAENIRILAAPRSITTVNQNIPPIAPLGESIWLIPASQPSPIPGLSTGGGVMFLGFRSIIPPNVFYNSAGGPPFLTPPVTLGNFTLSMTNVDGPPGGNFAVWERSIGSGIDLHFDSTDGTTSQNEITGVSAATHTHYNIGMTKPGVYEVTFEASATIHLSQLNGNQVATGSQVYTFIVPFSGYETGTAECRFNDSSEVPVALYHAEEDCEYCQDRVALITENQDHGGSAQAYGFTLEFPASAPIAPNRVGIPKDLALALPNNHVLASPPFSINHTTGPGSLTTTDLGGGAYGFSFTASGIYRVVTQARFQENGSGSITLGEPVELVFLAGLDVDYGYTEWADSFERTHGKASGTLANVAADSDGDGIANGVEFQLFWNGFDPCIPDAGKQPMPRIVEGVSVLDNSQPETYAVLEYIRDTYKDAFFKDGLQSTGTPYGISPGVSEDLSEWDRWYVFSGAMPDGAFETAAEPDQDVGSIMKRRFRVPGNMSKAFFQFQHLSR